jgi:hypothetical protein
LINTTNNILKKFGGKVDEFHKPDTTEQSLPTPDDIEDIFALLDPDLHGFAESFTVNKDVSLKGYAFDITPAMREAVLYQGQAIPLNIQPDPDYDAANPAGEAADEAAGKLELDPDITHLRKTNAPPEISQQVAAQREAERKAYRDVANLRARIRRNNDLAAAATKMQQEQHHVHALK